MKHEFSPWLLGIKEKHLQAQLPDIKNYNSITILHLPGYKGYY